MTPAIITQQEDLERALRWDARVSPADIKVELTDGHVVLSGEVDSFARKRAAHETILNVPGVESVQNLIRVVARPPIADADLRRELVTTLERDARMEQPLPKVSVTNGIATLRGNVSSLYRRLVAEEICRCQRGVVDVRNEIEVEPQDKHRDATIRQRVLSALACAGLRDRDSISVEVNNRLVRLTGIASSFVEKVKAEAAASVVSGVAYVDNRLTVQGRG